MLKHIKVSLVDFDILLSFSVFREVNCCEFNEVHNLLACGTSEVYTCTLERPYMGLDVRKPDFGGLRTTKEQASLRIRAD